MDVSPLILTSCPMLSTVFLFGASSFQLLMADSVKKEVVFAQSVELPAGLIVRGKIKDVPGLTEVVKELIRKLPHVIQNVVVVIPEDSVVSKSMQLPGVSEKEINEAVMWEAEGFLHFPIDQAVIDWKLLVQDGTSHVLMQASEKDVVEDYVKIFKELKIEIDAIETPALALVRLVEDNPGVRLLLYVSRTEAILTLAKDQEVVATSVVAVSDGYEEILSDTVKHMMQYYKDFEVQWVQVGGIGVTNSLLVLLKKMKVDVGGFAIPFEVEGTVANQYLLALSASFKPLVPPVDSKTINLLPEEYVTDVYRKKQGAFMQKLLMVTVVLLMIIVAGVGGVYGWIIQQRQVFVALQRSVPAMEKNAVSDASNANKQATTVLNLSKNDHFPVELFEKIEEMASDKIVLATVNYPVLSKKGELAGVATDRVSMLAFKQALENLEEISSVYLPVSSFAEDKNIPFQMQFSLVGEKSKPKRVFK